MADTILSQNEIDYLNTQRIARIATVSISSDRPIQPDVDFDGEYIYNRNVAVVIDDLKTVDPWDPRGIRIYGDADVVTRGGGYIDPSGHSEHTYIRIRPIKKWSWGIDEPVFTDGKFNVKRAQAGVE